MYSGTCPFVATICILLYLSIWKQFPEVIALSTINLSCPEYLKCQSQGGKFSCVTNLFCGRISWLCRCSARFLGALHCVQSKPQVSKEIESPRDTLLLVFVTCLACTTRYASSCPEKVARKDIKIVRILLKISIDVTYIGRDYLPNCFVHRYAVQRTCGGKYCCGPLNRPRNGIASQEGINNDRLRIKTEMLWFDNCQLKRCHHHLPKSTSATRWPRETLATAVLVFCLQGFFWLYWKFVLSVLSVIPLRKVQENITLFEKKSTYLISISQ